MREDKARREEMEKRMIERDRRMVEVIGKVEGWEKEKRSGGDKEAVVKEIGEEWRIRVRRMEIKQDKKEREERINNVVIRGIEIEGKEVKEGVKKLWERLGLEEEGIKEAVRIGKAGRDGCGMVLVKLGRGGGGKEEGDGGEEKFEGQEEKN